jgi:glycosyltransferase involved in cell wall biosynthesis
MTSEVRQRPVGDVRPIVLVVAPFFPPAFLAGGPVRSLAGLVDQLHDEFVFYVLAVDHDLRLTSTLRGVVSGRWTEQSNAFVRFEPDRHFTLTNYRRWITETNPSVIYINSVFALRFSVLPLVAALLVKGARPTVILAPRGELIREALTLKSTKKKAYLAVYRLLGLPRRTTWNATSNEEANDLRTLFGSHITIALASELLTRAKGAELQLPEKHAGHLRVIFLSRIFPTKNLAFAIQRLAHVDGEIQFTIAGPEEDSQYAAECRALVQSLPASITVEFIGPVEHDEVAETIAAHHLFFLPSLAENYGHAIVEALSCARPVLVGNRTPWHELERRGLGHDLPLADPRAFERALQSACDQEQEAFVRQVGAMPPAVAELLGESAALEQNRAMFRAAANRAESS